jgi:LAO/AO transport system ATPase
MCVRPIRAIRPLSSAARGGEDGGSIWAGLHQFGRVAVPRRPYFRGGAKAPSSRRVQEVLMTESAPTPTPPRRPRQLTVADYVSGVLAGDRSILARAITLVESTSRLHESMAQEVLHRVMPHTGKAKRVGITGVPGVGKSTFIESLGTFLVERGQKIAVLTIDPTSSRSGGSILGDKTRMEKLCQLENAFIRPSPTGQSLGGVARRTRETMLLCEAAGYGTILVESVGVGQTEIALRSMVDFFLLLLLPGAGDELQGIKKGIVEMADLVAINKADGENRIKAELAKQDQSAALHYLQSATPGWKTDVVLCAGLTGEGVPELWEVVEKFYSELEPKGTVARRRQEQNFSWLESLIEDELKRRFYEDPRVNAKLPEVRQALIRGEMTAVRAAAELIQAHREGGAK